MTEPQIGGTYDELLAIARWAEGRGLHSFARSDHYYSGREPRPDATDAFATLAGLARETSTIRLCVLVTPVTFRHPAVIAKNAVTIDQMSNGRLDLGVGTGWMDVEHEAFGFDFPEWPERFERLTEALHYLDAAFNGGTYEGTHYTLDADVQPRPIGLRTIVGGSGAVKTPTLAGTHANEYNHFIASPETIAPKIAVMREAAEAAGRDPSSIRVSVMGPALVATEKGAYSEKLGAAASAHDTSPSELEERWAGAGIPIGTADRAQATMAELEAAGVDLYYAQQIELDEMDAMTDMFTALGA
jgi:alkanesulfonate monooxygenase SsuD/methylene tetrahydromethanopterin reductase-like flavin-dependent oxidoreductase (luciferase family)